MKTEEQHAEFNLSQHSHKAEWTMFRLLSASDLLSKLKRVQNWKVAHGLAQASVRAGGAPYAPVTHTPCFLPD